MSRRFRFGEDLFSILSGVAFQTILDTLTTPQHSSSKGKMPIFAELAIPGLGRHLLKKKNAEFLLIGYLVWACIDFLLLFTVVCIPVILVIELAIRAVALKFLVSPVVCEHCGIESPFNALYCSNCKESFDKKKVVCPHCLELNTKGIDICEHCEESLAEVQKVKLCNECKHENDLDAKFCAGCGGDLTIIRVLTNCPQCNQKLKPSDIYCDECGLNLINYMGMEESEEQTKTNKDNQVENTEALDAEQT